MKAPNGFVVDIALLSSLPQDRQAIKMNVDNFDEAYELLKSHGFKNVQGEKVTDTGTSLTTLMVSPSGFAISLSQFNQK